MKIWEKTRRKLPEIDRKSRYFFKYHSFEFFFSFFVFSYIIFSSYTFLVFVFETPDFQNMAYAKMEAKEVKSIYGGNSGEVALAHISIPKINLDLSIANPSKIDNESLNQALLNGIIRYPKSGSVDQGNILLLGHSSKLKNVKNSAYKAFNNLDKLDKGDEILILNENKIYIYKVDSVSVMVGDETLIKFNTQKQTLTLSTCNVLGKREERIVVVAHLLE